MAAAASPPKDAGDVPTTFTRFACIGTGFSGIGVGATLKRWYGIDDICLFEKEGRFGGTWNMNRYPGCACDIPSALYSFSFETNADWTRALAPADELWAYLDRVARKYDLPRKTRFRTSVERCEWLEEKSRWRLHARDLDTGALSLHEAQFVFSATGFLIEPLPIDVPGADTFQGPVFHSSRWRSDVSLDGKDVVVFGNGCTASQIVPSIVGRTRHLTQFVRSKHWTLPAINEATRKMLRFTLRYVPGAAWMQRYIVFSAAEREFAGFGRTPAANQYRKRREAQLAKYMRDTAPEKYHSLLIPEYDLGCKRRIYDSGYLECLHRDNITLTDEPVVEIVPEGVRRRDGTVTKADVIICANGFVSNKILGGLEVVGRGGETILEHWDSFGGPEAYNCTAMRGFPNFFMILGPNSATGHSSTVLAIENSINYALRIIRPLLDGRGTIAEVKQEAEEKYVAMLHAALDQTVWTDGCNSWYTRDKDGQTKWNGSMYPFGQWHYWYRSLWLAKSDWQYRGPVQKRGGRWPAVRTVALVAALALLFRRRADLVMLLRLAAMKVQTYRLGSPAQLSK